MESLHFDEFFFLIFAFFLQMQKSDQDGKEREDDRQDDSRLQHGGRRRNVDESSPFRRFVQGVRVDHHRRVGNSLLKSLILRKFWERVSFCILIKKKTNIRNKIKDNGRSINIHMDIMHGYKEANLSMNGSRGVICDGRKTDGDFIHKIWGPPQTKNSRRHLKSKMRALRDQTYSFTKR